MPCNRCHAPHSTPVPIAVDGEVITVSLCDNCMTYYAAPVLPPHPVTEDLLLGGLVKMDSTLHHRIPLSRLVMMAKYMYDNQYDIVDFLCESIDSVSEYRLREVAKNSAAELKEQFPELKQHNVVYVNLLIAMRELFDDDD